MDTKTLTAYAEVKILWAKMCRAMNIDPKAQFVAGIPPTAPFYTEYNNATARFQRLVAVEKSQHQELDPNAQAKTMCRYTDGKAVL
jgi:hypothetical protein